MKIVIAFILMLFSTSAFAQVDKMQQKKDSLGILFKQQLAIDQAKANSVSNILAWSSTEIVAIVDSKIISKEQKLNQIKLIASQRDQNIAALLTPVQIQKLKKIMSAYKQQIKQKEINRLNSKG